MPYPNFHAGRMKSPGLFARILVLKTLPNGIMVYGGPLKSDPRGSAKTQAYRFPKSKFTVAQARKWLKDHNKTPILFEPAKKGESYEAVTAYPNFHVGRVKSPGYFARILVLKTLPNGILVYGGPLKTDPRGGAKTQEYRFPKSKFTADQAKAWLKDHNVETIQFVPAKKGESRESIKEYYKKPITLVENAVSFTGDSENLASLIRIPPREKIMHEIILRLNESLPENKIRPIDDFWGAFTDIMPVYDLVLMPSKIDIRTSIQESILEDIKDSDAQVQARDAQKKDAITLGEFFLQPRMSIPSINTDNAIGFLEQIAVEKNLKTEIPPAIIQKSYDGISAQVHKDGNFVTIYASDGANITDRFPALVEEIQRMKEHELVIAGEIELEGDDSILNIHTLLYGDKIGDVHNCTEMERTKFLNRIDFPAKGHLNLAPTSFVDTIGEAERALSYFSKAHDFSGAVIKFSDAKYSLSGTTMGMVKFSVDDLEEALHFAMPHPSGKARIANKIVAKITEHTTYVEPFCGAASVFFTKKKEGKEILNDLSPDIYFAMKFVQSASEESIKKIEGMDWTSTRAKWMKLKVAETSKNQEDRLYNLVYIHKYSYGKKGVKGGYDPNSEGQDRPPKNLRQLKERLQGVEILNKDYKEVIKKYDSPNTFFYLDPPYPKSPYVTDQLWKNAIDEDEFEKCLESIKGKWLLSYMPTKRFKNCQRHAISLPAMMLKGQSGVTRTETLISNYKIQENTDHFEEAQHSRSECMECSKPPTKEVLWAEGMAHAWFCDGHFTEWMKEHKDDADYVKEVKNGEAAKKFADNTNPNIMKEAIATGKFVIQHQWLPKGKVEHWDLRIDIGEEKLMHMVMESDILTADKDPEISFYFKDCEDKESMELGKTIEKIDLATWVSMKDSGEVLLLENESLQKKFEFKGKKFSGLWTATRENDKSDWWVLKRSKLSQPQ